MDDSLVSRVPIDSLLDVETFLSAAQHLKALTLQLHGLRARQSRRERSLESQIACITDLLTDKARGNPRIAEFWRVTQLELATIADLAAGTGTPCTAPNTPCKGGSRGGVP